MSHIVSSLYLTAEVSVAGGGPSKHVYYLRSMNPVPYPHRSAEASIAGGGPSKHVYPYNELLFHRILCSVIVDDYVHKYRSHRILCSVIVDNY